jgi:hypothetical protein
MFQSTTIIRELTLSLAKVTLIISVKVRRCGLCGGVAVFYIKFMVMCVLFAVHSAQHKAHTKCCHTTAWSITTYFYRFCKRHFSSAQCKLSDGSRRLKHVGEILM